MNEDESHRNEKEAHDIKLWGVFLFGLVGAAVTAFSLSRSQSKAGSGGSFRSSFQEEAWKRYNKRLQEEYKEEMERVERIKRMQTVFNREREKRRRSYESWMGNGGGAHHQHFQRDDWYWKAEESFREQWANYQHTPRESRNYSLSHHYSVLGLDRFRTTPYTDAEIKTAFRTKAMQYHPDQNQDNRGMPLLVIIKILLTPSIALLILGCKNVIEASEAKFKEVVCSYEAIQKERKNHNL